MEMLEGSKFSLTVYFIFQRKGGLWPVLGNSCQGQSWWWEAEINLMCHLEGLHAENELAENSAVIEAQGPVPGTNNRTDLGFWGSRLQPSVAADYG